MGSIPGSRGSPGGGNGNLLQYSCLENHMGRGAWQTIAPGVIRVGHNLATKLTPLYFFISIILFIIKCLFFISSVCVCAKLFQSCLTLCDPMDCRLPVSSVHRDSPGKNTGLAAIFSSRGFSWPRHWTHVPYVSCIGRSVLYHQHHLGRPQMLPWWLTW